MDWEQLLSDERFYWPRDLSEEERPSDDPALSVFQADSSRITLSAPFHRLQRKTQVLPFPKTDYPRSRLTHTNEVSDCGRQIARMVARRLVDQSILRETQVSDFEDIVAAACKAHDIGNPPFGHSGEYAIQRWVEVNTISPGIHSKSSPLHTDSSSPVPVLHENFRNELLSFDGNAQGFRLLTETTGWRRKGGLQLTCAVLGAFSKYPWTINHDYLGKKKFGILNSSLSKAKYIYEKCGMNCIESSDGSVKYARHPLAYIVEAADDISYLTADLEDAVKSKVIPEKRAFEFLEQIAKDAIESRQDRKSLIRRADQISEGDGSAKLRYLKDQAHRAMKVAASDVFMEKYEAIMNGDFEAELLMRSSVRNTCIDIKDYFRNEVYDDKGKLRNEIFGSHVIENLLDFFFGTLFQASEDYERDGKTHEIVRKRLSLFPLDNYFRQSEITQEAVHEAVGKLSNEQMGQMVVDYVSGMTDPYATDIFQQLNGMERPSVNW